MTIIHMETESVREAAAKLDREVSAMHDLLNQLRSQVHALDWQGPSHDDFIREFDQLADKLALKTEDGLYLSQRVMNEVNEWEQVDQAGAQQIKGSVNVDIGDILRWSVATNAVVIATIWSWIQQLSEIDMKIRLRMIALLLDPEFQKQLFFLTLDMLEFGAMFVMSGCNAIPLKAFITGNTKDLFPVMFGGTIIENYTGPAGLIVQESSGPALVTAGGRIPLVYNQETKSYSMPSY